MSEAVNKSGGMVINLLAVLKWAAASLTALWMSLSTTVHLLCVMMALDFCTGLAGAFILRRISGAASFRGLMKKVMTLVLVYVGHVITKPLNVGFDLGEMVALAYVVNEVISIVENCALVGVPIPPILVQSLSKIKNVIPVPPGSSITLESPTSVIPVPPGSGVTLESPTSIVVIPPADPRPKKGDC